MNTSTTGHQYYGDAAALARAMNKQPTDPDVLALLRAATTRFINQLGYRLDYQDDAEIWLSGDGGPMLALPAAPIHGDPVVLIDGYQEALPIARDRYHRAGYQIARRSGILWLNSGWPEGLENIHITYAHGYDPIPADVQQAVTEAAILATKPAGVSRISTGDESIDFINRLAEGGTTATWAAAIDAYRLSNNGDGL